MSGWRAYGMLGLFLGAQFVALSLSLPFKSAGLSSTGNPNSVLDPLLIIVPVILASVVIVLLARTQKSLSWLRTLVLLGIGGSLYLTLAAALSLVLPGPVLLAPVQPQVYVDFSIVLSGMIAVTLLLALFLEPQWYIVDLVGFLAAGSLIALLGVSFGILPALILLAALAVYDAIAVYGTKHMISLADVATDLKLPILMVMPSDAGYDYTRAPGFSEQRGEPVAERAAMFMGLGDVVIPGVLVVSAFVWLENTPLVFGVLPPNLLVALGTLAGAVVGYLLLMRLVARGNAQAGLPLLNGGAILGYLLAFLLVYQNLTFGIGSAF